MLAVLLAGCGLKPDAGPGPAKPEEKEEVLTLEERREIARVSLDKGRVGDAAGHYRVESQR